MPNNIGLIILDGWGIGNKSESDAIYHANTPYMDMLLSRYPNSTLSTSGEDVGLPDGQMGNSEVGHLNIGAGRIVYQELTRINKAVKDGDFFRNPVLQKAFETAKETNSSIHFMGLVSKGGVHSSQNHLYALCQMSEHYGIDNAFVHAFTDGRDCDPKSGLGFVQELEEHIAKTNVKIATLIGRYYAMDRDNRWERIKKAYDLMVHGHGTSFNTASEAISASYEKEITDEFIDPCIIDKDGTIKNAVKLFDGLIVESVLIPTPNRTTACVSTQVGCSLDCKFCATAKLKKMRNLNPDEIYDQVKAIDQESRLYHSRPLSNIVFMGMGEPLMNYNNVLKSIDKITSEEGLGMSPKRITVSTSGIPKMIKKLADDKVKFNLAVSLHSAIQEKRRQIMPFATKFTLIDLKESLQYWYEKTNQRITYEYVIWEGINDTREDIDALIRYCKQVPCKVNLIEYNAIDDDSFKQAPKTVTDAYIYTLEKNRIPVTVRRSRGKDIDAACGQLANKK